MKARWADIIPKAFLLVCALLFTSSAGFAQVSEEWVARYNGTANDYDVARAIAVDADGNVYVTGISFSGSTIETADYVTVKYNASGLQQWEARYNGPANSMDFPVSIAVDAAGNVYVTGQSDDGSALNGSSSYDYATVKYNASGVQQWAARYDGPVNGNDDVRSMAIDEMGNVYVTGSSAGDEFSDYATVKYNSAGVLQWVERYRRPETSSNYGAAIALDPEGNVYVTGGSYKYGSTLTDCVTLKYNSAGDLQWEAVYNGPTNNNDRPVSIAVDAGGNVYIYGSSFYSDLSKLDYVTVKYNASGFEQWVANYDGPAGKNEEPAAMALDSEGNVYVTGRSQDGSESSTVFDFATVKYNTSGVQQWEAIYNGPANNSDGARAIALDSEGNVYVTGYSYGASGVNSSDYATVQYNASGGQQWVAIYNGPDNSSDVALALALDADNNVYVTGFSHGSGSVIDYATIKYSQNLAPVAVDDAYSTNEDVPLQVAAPGILSNDSDIDNDGLTVVLLAGPSYGSLTLNPDGSFMYTPAENFNGSDHFTYQASDGKKSSNIATVTITINTVNDAPILKLSFIPPAVDELTNLTFLASSIDVEEDAVTYSLIGTPAGATIDAATGGFSWTPTEAQDGPHSFTVKVTDNGNPALSDEQLVNVTVNEVNVAPVLAVISHITTPWGNEVSFTATASDVDLVLGVSNSLSYSLEGAVPAGALIDAATGAFSWTPTQYQIGMHSITVKVTDNGVPSLSDEQTFTIEISKRLTALTYTGDLERQYSDEATLVAILMDVTDGVPGTAIGGKAINFSLGTQAPSSSPVTSASGEAAATMLLNQAPQSTTVLSQFAEDELYLSSEDNDAFAITKEDAIATYTGALFASTSGSNSSTATVTFSATLQDITAVNSHSLFDAFAGDILKASLAFKVIETGEVVPATLGYVSFSDKKTAVATASWTADIGNSDSKQYTVEILVDGYYRRSTGSDDYVVVTVSKPLNDFVTGGGFIIPISSAGEKAADAGRKNNFGFNIKYNKKGTNLQGNINTIIRRTEADGILHVYQIKGNKMSSLSVQPIDENTSAAVFNGKASIQDITDPNNLISVDGNATLQVDMTDMGEPGSSDKIAITVWNKSGGLWFSSNWDGAKTNQLVLSGGNLRIRGGATAAVRSANGETALQAIAGSEPSAFSFYNYPNTFSGKTTISFVLDREERYSLEVYDLNGKLVKKLTSGTAEAGKLHEYEMDASEMAKGMFIARLVTQTRLVNLRMLKVD